MKHLKKIALTSLAIFVLAMAVPAAIAQGKGVQYQHSAGIVTLETDDINMKITGVGRVPHFHWWNPDNPTVDYHMMFVKMFEANDTNSDGAFDLGTDTIIGAPFALPTSDWEFSGFDIEEDNGTTTAVHFNLTTTDMHDPRPSGVGQDYGNLPPMAQFEVYIQIRVHLDLENASNEVKFDLIIDGWQWTYEDSILVFQFTITESQHGESQGDSAPAGFQKTGTQFNFANGYMQYEETALAAQNQLEVKASYGEGTGQEAGESVYLAFEYFGNDTLEYDPTLGILSDGSLPLDVNTFLLIGAGVAAVVIIAAIVVKLRK